MNPKTFNKQVWEERILEFKLVNSIAPSDSISSVAAVVLDSDGTDVSATMIIGSPTSSGTSVFVEIAAGTHGDDYNLRVRVNTTDGEKIEDDLRIRVRDVVYT